MNLDKKEIWKAKKCHFCPYLFEELFKLGQGRLSSSIKYYAKEGIRSMVYEVLYTPAKSTFKEPCWEPAVLYPGECAGARPQHQPHVQPGGQVKETSTNICI